MSAAQGEPDNTPGVLDEPSTEALIRDMHRMVSELHALVTRLTPAVEKVMGDIQSGGLMGLLGGMMGPRR